ncbi:MAG: uracil-DNA glycosylase [bacterium]|nr:uracil-DNA glycosylase [bacterium]
MSDAGAPWADLREWVAYLSECGVRDLRLARPPAVAAGAASRPAGPAASKQRASEATRPATDKAPASAGDAVKRLALIRDEIGECTRCKLHEQRNNIVFGVGHPDAGLMFVGEGPGAEEDARGEPFVGRAGKKLDEMIVAIGLRREDVYIANIVKCRPPGNRDPQPDEIGTCSPFLNAQIEAIRPSVIVTLGAPATRLLLQTRIGITKLRGTWHEFNGVPVMPTFHPAYLLRRYTVENRRAVWEDLQAARSRMDGTA